MTKLFLISLTALSMAFAGLAVHANFSVSHASASKISEETAEAFIQKLSNEGLAFLANDKLSIEQKKVRFKQLLDNKFDIKTIGQFALGVHWRNVSDSEKKEYLNLFENMVVNVYARRFNEYQGQKFEIMGARERGKKDFIVSSRIHPPEGQRGAKVSVDWRLRDKNGTLKVIDISVEGISMIMTQRADFAAVIQKGQGEIEFLLAELRKSD
jgi:phospholipid transport system substrate-binding protein|tara:strand:+ start:229501 stop:230136 length:636 start_codon:yes stop_codon:yes gene_type:complete